MPELHLTEREQEVLDLTAAGWGVRDIAERLNIGRHRVQDVREQIKTKINLPLGQDVGAMVAKARELGLVSSRTMPPLPGRRRRKPR